MLGILQDWLSLLLRWAHIVAGIGWIGSSFYFMWLDASLKRSANSPPGVKGENWTVHGGGFYHIQKYAVAPETMPADLYWFKWESYSTWLTGFALLSVTYYWSASSYLIDRSVADLAPWQGVAISVVGLGLGWNFYDQLCKSALKANPPLMFAVLFAAVVAASWAYGFVFAPRAVFIQIGATVATLMTGNVFLVIIPNQKIVVEDLKAGRVPDARYGEIAKLRSTHNNYLTLPVLFMMISNHYPMTFGHEWNWGVVAFVLALGAIIRDWFNRHEAGETGLGVDWQWPACAALTAGLIAFSAWKPSGEVVVADRVLTADALAIVQTRCTSCHSATPTNESFEAAPGGIMFDIAGQLKAAAQKVLAQTVLTEAMPLGNMTEMTPDERARLGAWIRAGMPDE
jgi:uncharacterized membrane protein